MATVTLEPGHRVKRSIAWCHAHMIEDRLHPWRVDVGYIVSLKYDGTATVDFTLTGLTRLPVDALWLESRQHLEPKGDY